MVKIDLKKGSALGFMLWSLLFIFASALMSYQLFASEEAAMYSTTFFIVLSGVASYMFARRLEINQRSVGFMYGLLWVAMGIILDRIVTNPFDHNMFSSVSYWMGYVLILIAPIIKVKKVAQIVQEVQTPPAQTAQPSAPTTPINQ